MNMGLNEPGTEAKPSARQHLETGSIELLLFHWMLYCSQVCSSPGDLQYYNVSTSCSSQACSKHTHTGKDCTSSGLPWRSHCIMCWQMPASLDKAQAAEPCHVFIYGLQVKSCKHPVR